MIITYYGASCFRVQSGETVLVFDPPSKGSSFKSPRFQTDIVLVSANHKDHNGWDNLSGKNEKESPFVINGPGEYEAKGIFIKGIFAKTKDSVDSIYVLKLEDITLCHLGAFDGAELTSEIKEEIGEIDILFAPVGAGDGEKSAKIAAQLESNITIPMNYDEKSLKTFLKEIGDATAKPEEKLTIKKKDIKEDEGKVVVLSSN